MDFTGKKVVHKVWGEGVVTKPATCAEAGVKTFTCTDCGETYTEAIPSTGHSFPETWNADEENRRWHPDPFCP